MQLKYVNKTRFNFFDIILFLFPILPQYIYVVGGINVVNSLAVLMVFYCLITMKIRQVSIVKHITCFWIYMAFYAVRYFVDTEYMKGITHILIFMVVPYLIVSTVSTKKRFLFTVDILIAAGMILGIFGVFEAVLKVNFFQSFAPKNMQFFHDVRYGLLRIMVTFGQPIGYGIYQVFIVALISYRQNTEINNTKAKYLKRVKVLSIINVILSVSRGPIFAMIALLLVLSYNKAKKRFYIAAFIIVILLLIGSRVYVANNISIPFIDDVVNTINQLVTGDSSGFGGAGVGNRLELQDWVLSEMGDSYVWGKGTTAAFAYKVYEWQTKTSIENQYLYIMYHIGFVGLILLVLSYLNVLFYALINGKKNGMILNEHKLSFNKLSGIMMFIYFIFSLSCQETDMTRMYVVMIALMISYNRLNLIKL